jgi:hypothetical protein
MTVRFRAEQQLPSLSAIVFLPPQFSEQLGSACEIYPRRFFVSSNEQDRLPKGSSQGVETGGSRSERFKGEASEDRSFTGV